MVDLAIKILMDDKARFATTVTGVAFAVAWSMSRSACSSACSPAPRSRSTGWTPTSGSSARNTPNVDFANPFPESLASSGSARCPGVARADNLIVWFATVALPGGAKESAVIYALKDFARWNLPWDVLEGDPRDLRRGLT